MARNGTSAFALLVRAHAIAQTLAAEMLFECGVSVLEAWVLEEIPENGQRCASEIAQALDVPTSTVTRALRRLEGYGYLTLTKGIFLDARVLRPKLTDMGCSVRQAVVGFEGEVDRMLLHDLQPVEASLLISGLVRFTRRAERETKGDGTPPWTTIVAPQLTWASR